MRLARVRPSSAQAITGPAKSVPSRATFPPIGEWMATVAPDAIA